MRRSLLLRDLLKDFEASLDPSETELRSKVQESMNRLREASWVLVEKLGFDFLHRRYEKNAEKNAEEKNKIGYWAHLSYYRIARLSGP